MKRRFFLRSLGVFWFSQLLLACRQSNQNWLQVNILKNTLPPQLISQFRQQTQSRLSLSLSLNTELTQLYEQLETWQLSADPARSQNKSAHLTSLGDHWLTPAIKQNLIQPLQPQQLPQWLQLSPRWQALVRRDAQGQLSPEGKIWGAPYRWGGTMIAYRRDKFRSLGWTPTDWSDLWRPELKRKLSILEQPREVIGLTLKHLQHSYNSQNPAAIGQLLPQLQALDQQVKFYGSTNYLQPLILGDTWAAVGWSSDILPVLEREREIMAVVPQSGTALWADLWVHAAALDGSKSTEAVNTWINYWWDPQVTQDLSQFTNALSPFLDSGTASGTTQQLLLPHPEIFERSEFLQPLPQSALEQYWDLWQQMRQTIYS